MRMHSPRLHSKVLSSAQIGRFLERVDFLCDFRSAFRLASSVPISVAVWRTAMTRQCG